MSGKGDVFSEIWINQGGGAVYDKEKDEQCMKTFAHSVWKVQP